VVLLACASVLGQSRSEPTLPAENCLPGTNYEAQGYSIRNATIDDPWHFLMTFGVASDSASQAVAALRGRPYHFEELKQTQQLIEKQRFLPADINLSAIEVENCSEKQLDVVFHVFSVQISPVLSSTFEFRELEETDPQKAAGSSLSGHYLAITPRMGYDETDRFFGGAEIQTEWPPRAVPLDSFSFDGYGSPAMHSVSASLAGHYDSATNWLGHAEWRLDFQNSSLPTDRGSLKQSSLALGVTGQLHPLRGVVPRFGITADGGDQQSGFAPGDLAPHTVADSRFGSAKIYLGITAHPRHQALAASYALELGSTGVSFGEDWRKHLADIAYECWWPVADHRLFELEQRLAAGEIETLGSVPVTEKFFGGNAEQQFMPGDAWKIRANPVIRSIPANRFYRTSSGAGGNRFISYNLTAALTAWRKPIVPGELTADPEFTQKLDGAITSAVSILQVSYASADPHFQDTLLLLPEAAASLDRLNNALTEAQPNLPSSLKPAWDACTRKIRSSSNYVKRARAGKPLSAYGYVQELLPDGVASLADVVSACGSDLNGTLKDPAIQSASGEVDAVAHRVQTTFGLIDQDAASTRAAADMSYVRRTLDIILKEVNITAVSPVFVFDAARIGPGGNGPYTGTRYGTGGGVRFSLASTASFTAGYAWNVTRHAGEAPGAIFFSFDIRNLLH
jgi:hypothetical protein